MTVDRADNLFDYFRTRVEAAVADEALDLDDDATLYLAQLLVDRARTDRDAPSAHTLAELHAAAAQATPGVQARTYRELGDRALYDLAYFPEALERRIVDASYYEAMGRAAYVRVDEVLARWFSRAFGTLFADLAAGFRTAARALASVRRAHDEDEDLGALYTAWLSSGDEGIARKLRRMGLLIPRRPTAEG